MKLLKVYRTDQDLVVDTSDGRRVCKLRHSNFVDIDALESQCKDLIGKEVKTIAFQHEKFGDKYFYKISEVEGSNDELKKLLVQQIPLGKTFKNHSSQKIFGPPGTGKTTFLLNKVKEHVANGVDPKDIAFISYTNAAANEAKKRVSENFPGMGSVDFPNFSTMLENLRVRPLLKSFWASEVNLGNKEIAAGKAVNENINAKKIPTTIIFPKSITGLISLTANEANATIVVRAV